MKLKSMTISGFRGFARTQSFDLEADAIILAGVNGSGKTSFFDALLWALSGSVSRLTDTEENLVSKWSPSGEARVEVHLSDQDGREIAVTRRWDGRSHLTVSHHGNSPVSGPAAEASLIDVLWPDAKTAADPRVALNRSLTRATYLQQDSVREFVQSDDEQTRFQVVGELVGAGRIVELQRQLESSRNAWTRVTTTLKKDLEPLHARASELSARLATLGESSPSDADDELRVSRWQDDVRQLAEGWFAYVANDSTDEGVQRTLEELARATQDGAARLVQLQALARLLERGRPAEPDMARLKRDVEARGEELHAALDRLANAERAAAAHRRAQVEASEIDASRRALAELAMRHLGPQCPVCGQDDDPERTLHKLQAELSRSDSPAVEPPVNVSEAAQQVERIEGELAAARQRLNAGQAEAQAAFLWDAQVAELAETSDLSTPRPSQQELAIAIAALEARLKTADTLRAEGERISVGVVRRREAKQRAELSDQLARLRAQIALHEASILERDETAATASAVIDALREANDSLVSLELEQIEPLLQRIFATVDPHPNLRLVRFLTKTVRGRGRLWTTLGDVTGTVSTDQPGLVLSSSQLNVLAVATYLALNLSIQTLPLQVTALDDPLQSLDTVNLLGLADLLRRVKDSRQVLVSTHDPKLASLLERKLRPVREGDRTVRYDFSDWAPAGPSVRKTARTADAPTFRLVSTA